jgi:putative ABC transport system permease protein
VLADEDGDGAAGDLKLGDRLTAREGVSLTVVGMAQSISRSADGWVTPAQAVALRPHSAQMMYRFAAAGTDAEVSAGSAVVSAGLPDGALLGTRSYLALKRMNNFEVVVPLLTAFGILGLAVSILIIVNVISGAVISGYRHIGVLKALGFTPGQVVAVYLLMIALPALLGALAGTLVGNLLAQPLLMMTYQAFGVTPTGVALWVDLVGLVGIPAVAAAAALGPAIRAGRLRAREAISAGVTPRGGRGRTVQRWLAGTRLPRAVSLGLGLSFTRPARSMLTLASIVLGAGTVTFAAGMHATTMQYGRTITRPHAVQVEVALTDAAAAERAETTLRGRPGTRHLTAERILTARSPGDARPLQVHALRGDSRTLGYELMRGRWIAGPGEVVLPQELVLRWGRGVGQSMVLDFDGRTVPVRIVGELVTAGNDEVFVDWSTAPVPALRPQHYLVGLAPGTDADRYVREVGATDAGLTARVTDRSNDTVRIFTLLTYLMTLVMAVVSVLGVLNTVILTVRERVRDVAVLKSIGMTPAQVIVAVVTSIAGIGLLGGLLGVPVGVLAHRIVIGLTARADGTVFPPWWIEVYRLPDLVLVGLAGIVIAVLGALLPAGWAARVRVATALHNE